MMNRFYLALVVLSTLSYCGDILEEDISSQKVILRSPIDGTEVTSNIVSFWWESVPGAKEYSIHVVSPNFQKTTKVILDSTTSKNLINIELSNGTYAWEVRAQNSSYQTEFSQGFFEIKQN